MRDAGVHVVSMFAVACDLMRDWRNTPGAAELFPFYDRYVSNIENWNELTDFRHIRYFSAYGMLARGHQAAMASGQLQPGEPSP